MTQTTSQDLRRDQAAHRWTRSIIQDREEMEWTPEQWEEIEKTHDYEDTFRLVRLLLTPSNVEFPPVLKIVFERFRQIRKWGPEHDAEHDITTLAQAGVAYLFHYMEYPVPSKERFPFGLMSNLLYPWDNAKPRGAEESLRIAGALVIAEMERLLMNYNEFA